MDLGFPWVRCNKGGTSHLRTTRVPRSMTVGRSELGCLKPALLDFRTSESSPVEFGGSLDRSPPFFAGYDIDKKKLGEGSYGTVSICTSKATKQKRCPRVWRTSDEKICQTHLPRPLSESQKKYRWIYTSVIQHHCTRYWWYVNLYVNLIELVLVCDMIWCFQLNECSLFLPILLFTDMMFMWRQGCESPQQDADEEHRVPCLCPKKQVAWSIWRGEPISVYVYIILYIYI